MLIVIVQIATGLNAHNAHCLPYSGLKKTSLSNFLTGSQQQFSFVSPVPGFGNYIVSFVGLQPWQQTQAPPPWTHKGMMHH